MSPCCFTFGFSGSATALLNRIDNAIKDAGGSFQTLRNAGSFTIITPFGSFRGQMTILEQTVYVEVNEKPRLISCNSIKTKLEKYISRKG